VDRERRRRMKPRSRDRSFSTTSADSAGPAQVPSTPLVGRIRHALLVDGWRAMDIVAGVPTRGKTPRRRDAADREASDAGLGADAEAAVGRAHPASRPDPPTTH
jgi:hypothetical protein